MSIPKEPRQLMINLMYLVLTALLALNISAEIINAFFMVEKGIKKSNKVIENTNFGLFSALSKQADAYPQYQNLRTQAEAVRAVTEATIADIKTLRENLVEAAGGYDEEGPDPTLPKRKKDKDITTRILVNEGKGEELRLLLETTRQQLLDLVEKEEDKAMLAENIPLNVSPIPENTKAKSWAEFNFKQMPIAAVLPMLAKFESDTRVSETVLLNYLMSKTSTPIVFNQFLPVASAASSYVIRGDQYEAEIMLSATSSKVDNMAIYVDGQKLPVRDGKAIFKRNPDRLGSHSYEAKIVLTNPLTKKREQYTKKFKYTVGERSLAVSALKMNVFYLGVDNPVEVSAAGINSNKLKVNVSGGGASVRKGKDGNFVVKVKKITRECKLTVSADGMNETRVFRVKRIPDPVARLGKKSGGAMSAAEFRAQEGVIPFLDNFDFEARCEVLGFELARVPKNNSPMIFKNRGGRFKGDAKKIKNAAKNGDTFYFTEVKAKCPGDEYGREINGMVFKIR